MHGDAAGWAKMEEASAVAHRMEAVEGRETGRRDGEDWRRSASVCGQRRRHTGRGEDYYYLEWSWLAKGPAGRDEFHSESVALETWISTSLDGESRLF